MNFLDLYPLTQWLGEERKTHRVSFADLTEYRVSEKSHRVSQKVTEYLHILAEYLTELFMKIDLVRSRFFFSPSFWSETHRVRDRVNFPESLCQGVLMEPSTCNFLNFVLIAVFQLLYSNCILTPRVIDVITKLSVKSQNSLGSQKSQKSEEIFVIIWTPRKLLNSLESQKSCKISRNLLKSLEIPKIS